MSPSPMLKSDHDYQAEDDHRTLTRAQEIAEDKGRMKGVRKHHAKQSKALRKLSPLMRAGMQKGRR